MRALQVFIISMKQKRRDPFSTFLTIGTAPLFVVLYWLLFSGASASYTVLISAPKDAASAATALIDTINTHHRNEDSPVIAAPADNVNEIETQIKRGTAHAGLLLTSGFSDNPANGVLPEITIIGDVASVGFQVAGSTARTMAEALALQRSRRPPPLQISHRPIGVSGEVTAFEAYVPGLLVFAVIMLIFSASMSVAKETEAGTLGRLRMTPLPTAQLLLGVSASQLLLGAISVILTLMTAWLLGFHAKGSIVLSMFIALLASMASIGVGMLVASISRTQTRAFLIGSAAMFLLVLFSGVVFPTPQITIYQSNAFTIDLFDVLPTVHLGQALHKILILGASFRDVAYETLALTAISAVTFLTGGALFIRTGKPASTTWEGMP